MKVCIVSSCGGHLTEVRCLKKLYEKLDHFYVINDKIGLPSDMQENTYFIVHSERDWLFFYNLWEAFCILKKEKPSILLSTGASPVIAFTIIGRLFFNCRVIYIECITRVNRPSLTGRIMYHLTDKFFYQWKSLSKYFPKGVYGGPII